MTDDNGVVAVLSRFARRLVVDYAVSDALRDLTDAVIDVLEVAGAGVSLSLGGTLRLATATSETVRGLELIQEDTRTGPCIDAFRLGAPVVVPDLSAQTGCWPSVAEAAATAGIGAVAAVPIRLDGRHLGVLSMYVDHEHEWTGADLSTAGLLADMAAAHVANTSAFEESRRTAEQLQEALDSRVVIEQAKGMIAADRRVSVDAAFQVLRRHARDHGVPLTSVAEAVVNLGLRP